MRKREAERSRLSLAFSKTLVSSILLVSSAFVPAISVLQPLSSKPVGPVPKAPSKARMN